MSSPRVIDIDAMLVPIAEDRPGGANPRDDSSPSSLYYRIKDARNAARTAERMAVDLDATKPEEWQVVADCAIELLTTQSKDLEAAVWLTEALLRLEGYPGLRDGFTLLAGLVETFWDHLYPEPDEDGIETRIAPIAGLNGAGTTGTLEQPIRMAPIAGVSATKYSLWHYEQALELERITDAERRQARVDAGAVSLEQFNQAVAEMSPQDVQERLQDVEETLAALKTMSDALDKMAGSDSPPIGTIRDLLQRSTGSIRHFGADKLAAAKIEAEVAGDGAVGDDGGAAQPAGGGQTSGAGLRIEGFISREEALGALARIASFFRKTEPHSPLSYTIDEAVRRARLSLPELLKELTQDSAHADYFLLAAGIKGATTASESE